MTFEDIVRRLEQALAGPLPGEAAQQVMAPRPRRQWPAGFNPARIRHAAGLLLLVPEEIGVGSRFSFGEPPDLPASPSASIVLTVRADTLGRHRGQVSLPGGAVDPGETFEQAALREAREEVGLSPDGVRILGQLTPLDIPVSGFRLHPIVAALPYRPPLSASDGEVAAILHVPLTELTNPQRLVESEREREGIPLVVPAFHVAGVEIWGATAMVLAEFLTLLGWRRTDTYVS
jgi:8-oxo-dGTP pyrophosphatase MutT (NUDIX family)